MINESIYAALIAGIQEAFADLESHMDDPDASQLSGHGMLELTRDRLATLAAMPYMPGAVPPAQPAAAAMSGALRAIHERMVYARRGGDEGASEFLAEEWPQLVPAEVRALLGTDED